MHQNMVETSFLLCKPFVKRMWAIYDQIIHGIVSEMFVWQFLDGEKQGVN
jgi:hypothetical protein